MAFRNLAREYTATTGTSDAVLTGAVPGCNTWEDAGVTNGEVVRYGIITYDTSTHRPTHSEVGIGSYNTGTNTLARTTVESSTNAGSKITLTGLSEVYITPTRKDQPVLAAYYGASQTVNSTVTGALLDISSEWTDEHGIATLASDVITVNYPCWLQVSAHFYFESGTAFNGSIHIENPDYSVRRGYSTADNILNDTIFFGPFTVNCTATHAISFEVDNLLGSNIDIIVNDVTLTAWVK